MWVFPAASCMCLLGRKPIIEVVGWPVLGHVIDRCVLTVPIADAYHRYHIVYFICNGKDSDKNKGMWVNS